MKLSFHTEDGRVKHGLYLGQEESNQMCWNCVRSEDCSCPSGHGEIGVRYDREDSCYYWRGK